MMLRDATPREIDDILAGTHALWSDGLELEAYREYIRTLMASDWAAGGPLSGGAPLAGPARGRNYRFLALEDAGGAGGVAAAMKLYRFRARLDGEAITVGGIGAVFTPPALRRRGSAARMLDLAHRIMADRGDALSLLFSEIGTEYYARLGYRAMSSHAVRVPVPVPASGAGAAAGSDRRMAPAAAAPAQAGLKRMHREDLEAVIRLRDREDAAAPFALTRDHACWKYLLARASYPTLSLGRDQWESRLMMAGDRGYLWALFGATHEGSAAKLLEFGEAAPGAALGPLLDDLFAECRRRGVASLDAWLPPAAAARDPRLGPGAGAVRIDPPPALPMWLPLGAEAGQDMALHAAAAVLQMTDIF